MILLAAASSQGNITVADYLLPTASLLSVAIFGYIARSARKYLKGHSEDHRWLEQATKDNSDQIAENTRAIKTMLEQRERLISQRPPATPRRKSPR